MCGINTLEITSFPAHIDTACLIWAEQNGVDANLRTLDDPRAPQNRVWLAREALYPARSAQDEARPGQTGGRAGAVLVLCRAAGGVSAAATRHRYRVQQLGSSRSGGLRIRDLNAAAAAAAAANAVSVGQDQIFLHGRPAGQGAHQGAWPWRCRLLRVCEVE